MTKGLLVVWSSIFFNSTGYADGRFRFHARFSFPVRKKNSMSPECVDPSLFLCNWTKPLKYCVKNYSINSLKRASPI